MGIENQGCVCSGGSRNLERGVQPQAHPKFWIATLISGIL